MSRQVGICPIADIARVWESLTADKVALIELGQARPTKIIGNFHLWQDWKPASHLLGARGWRYDRVSRCRTGTRPAVPDKIQKELR